MQQAVFVITIDTEGDNLWLQPKTVTTRNALYLPRFQDLCEKHSFRPTYLVNYEMASDPVFQQFGSSMLRRNAAEIGLHVHPWNSPPFDRIRENQDIQMYLYELPEEVLYSKLDFLTRLLTEIFGIRPISHRAGRWGFNGQIARALRQLGYRVDCSVTPGVSWKRYHGVPEGQGGPNYLGFPVTPYFLDESNVKYSGTSDMLEVPVTIKPNYSKALLSFYYRTEDRVIGKIFKRAMGDPCSWLRPNGENLETMLGVVDWAREQEIPVLEFMLHSSEFMPGGSPTFETAEQIERLYVQLDTLFSYIATSGLRGMTLAEYRATWE